MGVDASAVARVLGIETTYERAAGGGFFLPQRIAVLGQGASATTYTNEKFSATNHAAVGARFGYGSPLHRAARRLLPNNGDGVGSIPVTFYPLQDDASGVAAAGSITPSGTATETGSVVVKVSETRSEAVTITPSSSVADICDAIVAAVDAVLEMPVTTTDNSTDVDLTAKWQGESGNGIVIEIEGEVAGISFAIVQPTGGLNNPADTAVTTALGLMGNVWETMVLNCLDIDDTDVLTAINTHGEGRWGTNVRKPYVCFTGVTDTTVANAIAVSDARKSDRINAQLVAPGSSELPLDVAARQLARIARVANNNPPRDYGSQKATGLVPGDDGDQWLYSDRDAAVKGGSSTIEVRDGIVNIGDVVTFYHPSGVPDPAYRYVVDIVKLQNALFNLDATFSTDDWDGAPMIPDGQPTVNPAAKTPSMAKAAAFGVIDFLASNAIISNPDASIAATTAQISATSPKRLELVVPIQLSGNTNIISLDLKWGFHYGDAVAVA